MCFQILKTHFTWTDLIVDVNHRGFNFSRVYHSFLSQGWNRTLIKELLVRGWTPLRVRGNGDEHINISILARSRLVDSLGHSLGSSHSRLFNPVSSRDLQSAAPQVKGLVCVLWSDDTSGFTFLCLCCTGNQLWRIETLVYKPSSNQSLHEESSGFEASPRFCAEEATTREALNPKDALSALKCVGAFSLGSVLSGRTRGVCRSGSDLHGARARLCCWPDLCKCPSVL